MTSDFDLGFVTVRLMITHSWELSSMKHFSIESGNTWLSSIPRIENKLSDRAFSKLPVSTRSGFPVLVIILSLLIQTYASNFSAKVSALDSHASFAWLISAFIFCNPVLYLSDQRMQADS